MQTKPLLIGLGIIVLALIGYFFYAQANPAEAPMSDTATTTEEMAGGKAAGGTEPAGNVTITYTEDGFSPATVHIPLGTTVTWVNQTQDRMWVGANEHPTHTSYDGTAASEHCAGGAPASAQVFDQCTASARYSFTFTKAGTWNYHNHANASDRGSVTVTGSGVSGSANINADIFPQ